MSKPRKLNGKHEEAGAQLERRMFLAGTGAAVAAYWLKPGLASAAGVTVAPPAPGRALVLIQLAGGNDGLNTVVPHADPLYRKLRPKLALEDGERLLLPGTDLSFNAAMAKLHTRFLAGQVAVLQGVGYPHASRSHFESTAIWQTARLDPWREGTGWLARVADAEAPHPDSVLGALGLGGGGLTPAFGGAHVPVTSLASLEAFAVQPDRRFPADAPALSSALAALHAPLPGDNATTKLMREVGRTALRSSESLAAAVRGYQSSVEYPRTPFGDGLKLAAQLLSAPLGVRLLHVTLGGFDTHANQKAQQAGLLKQFSDGLSALLDDAAAHGLGDRLAVMTYSEFGRRAEENGSGGTDHGSGSVAFVVGSGVRGGLVGESPQLAKLDGGDVPFSLDFRSVYASALRDWLGIAPDRLLGGRFPGPNLFLPPVARVSSDTVR